VIRVLVVDDDFMVARIHARFVERTPGFEVVGTAHNGADALAAVATLAPDLLLLDVHLPDLSGLDVLDRLRRDGHRVAVVMVTAERGAEAVRAALHGGAMQYLVKPFDYDDLAERLRRVAGAMARLAGGSDQADGADGDGHAVDQATIDEVFGAAPGRPGRPAPKPALPKGLSPETADLVLSAARDVGEISATEAGAAVGLSRVTARRYLEHFADVGLLEVRLKYGATGRPERRYRLL
jgi:response regulator of citrate/malate metabolism